MNKEEDMFFENLAWMNSSEAARYLRISVGALRTAVYRGTVRSRKWGRKLYFRKNELDFMLEKSF
jgi:excisionase family DNA binding protein